MRTTTTVPCACGCGSPVTTPDTKGRAVRYRRGHAGHAGPVLPGPHLVICQDCGQERLLEGRNRCKRCYNAARKAGAFTPGDTRPAPVLTRADPETRLPRPVMVRCAGCPDVPGCPRAALPGSRYCLRCGPLAAEVAA